MNKTQKPTKAFKLSITASILILLNAALLGVVTTWFPGIMPTIPGTSNDTVPFTSLIAIGLVCGSLVLLGSLMLNSKPASKKAWGIVIIAFSVPTVIMGGGFIIGFIMGIIGGALALSKKTKNQTTL